MTEAPAAPAAGRPLRVLHLAGGASSAFYAELSRTYAAGCLAATADPARYQVHLAWVEPGGAWRFPADLTPAAVAAAPPVALGHALSHLAALHLDAVVPQMFDPVGMTAYRSLADLLGVPLVGNPADVMALGADKARARAVVAAAGVAVPAGQVVRAGQRPDLPLPVVVKPVDADNSLGVTLVREPGELDAALAAALQHSRAALVEAYVPLGREVRVGVLDLGGPGEAPVCLPLEEYAVDEATRPVRAAGDKLRPAGGGGGSGGGVELVAKTAEHAWLVADDDPVVPAVRALALAAHAALGCRDYGLFDVRVDPQGRAWFLEASLYCSFSPSSVLAVMAAGAGIEVAELLARAVHRAVTDGRAGAAGAGAPGQPAAVPNSEPSP